MSQSIAPAATGPDGLAILPAREAGEDLANYLWRLAQDLPAPEGDMSDAIAERVLAAGSMADENEVWESTSSQKLTGRSFVWHSLSWSPRQSKEGLPFFLICQVTDMDSGERTVLTTGAKNLVASLLSRYFRGDLPAAGEIVGNAVRNDPDKVALHMRWLGRQVNPGGGGDGS